VFHELHTLLAVQNFQHAAVKIYIQLLQSLSLGDGDVSLTLAMNELKTFVEPTTGLSQAGIWKALLLADMQTVEAKVNQLILTLKKIDTCKYLFGSDVDTALTQSAFITAQISMAGILEIAGLIKARKLQGSEAETEFAKLHDALLKVKFPQACCGSDADLVNQMTSRESQEPADFEVRTARGILAQLVSNLSDYSEQVCGVLWLLLSQADLEMPQSILQYAGLATQLDTASMTPLPALVALRTTGSSHGKLAMGSSRTHPEASL
jgi:hypothetical protein